MVHALKILPLALLVIPSVLFVWRGLGSRPDDTANRAKGGGPRWDFWRH